MEISNSHHQVTMASSLTLEEVLNGCKNTLQIQQQQQSQPHQDKKLRPQQHQNPLNCPRCDSTNTKFCYYNNYSLSQPRYFCKSCRRYWTKGGSLRNVPVGGGCRKNKKSSSSSNLANKKQENQNLMNHNNNNINNTFSLPPLSYHDPNDYTINALSLVNPNPNHALFPVNTGLGFLDIFKPSGMVDHVNIPNVNGLYSGFHVADHELNFTTTTTTTTATTVSTSSAVEVEGNKVLMGLPWTLRGGEESESHRSVSDFGSSWERLINNSLI